MLFGAHVPVWVSTVVDGQTVDVVMDQPDGPEACLWAAADQWTSLFPGSLPQDQRAWWTSRLSDPSDAMSFAHLRPVAFRVAEQVYGVPWWSAHRILQEAMQQYMAFEAWCISKGFSAAGEPAHRIVAAVVAWVGSTFEDEEEAKAWQARMSMRPKGVPA